eukprot:1184276-Prorocentrum_minimum.AAC.4
MHMIAKSGVRCTAVSNIKKGLWGVECTLAIIGTGGPVEESERASTSERVDALWRLEITRQTLVDGVCEVHGEVVPAGQIVEEIHHHEDAVAWLELGSLCPNIHPSVRIHVLVKIMASKTKQDHGDTIQQGSRIVARRPNKASNREEECGSIGQGSVPVYPLVQIRAMATPNHRRLLSRFPNSSGNTPVYRSKPNNN